MKGTGTVEAMVKTAQGQPGRAQKRTAIAILLKKMFLFVFTTVFIPFRTLSASRLFERGADIV